ncbi:hypothetical protein HK105_204391 [Polyrhizophydium stewartii]|uniref:Major facilitator superfamily (MFS) profile domain-containing protein n=1 Tax=Polyrhizophydium stewartii TaxID=2732419 RepID=A0ABR4N8W8_9FUNG|nr:hypothetical protein HK105_007098 [Polyrhizophydium stewartii]
MPFIAVGTVVSSVGLFLLWSSEPLWVYMLVYVPINVASAVSSVPYNGLIADVTPPEQNGRMSAVLGAANLAGYLVGTATGIFVQSLTETEVYAIMAAISLVFTVPTLVAVREPQHHFATSDARPPLAWGEFLSAMVRPLVVHRDFRLVFVSRMLFQLGIATMQQFLQYWIADCVATDMTPTRAVSVGLIPNLLLAPLAAMLIPSHDRKIVVYAAAALMIATCVLVMATSQFGWVLAVSGLFGSGFGPFLSVEFAMLMDVLPSASDAARDMGLWHMALVLPQIVATPVAGWILDASQQFGNARGMQCFGYQVVYGMCMAYFLAGVAVTVRIRGIK